MRTKFIDNDCRNEPKTSRFCIRCQKDIKPGSPTRMIHVTDHVFAIHPGDEPATHDENGGWQLLGMDCARIIGIEWTHATDERMVTPL